MHDPLFQDGGSTGRDSRSEQAAQRERILGIGCGVGYFVRQMTDLIGQAGRTAEEGMRVVVTDPGRIWEVEKAGRGDPSQGGQGTVLEVREEGKLCFVQWDQTGVIVPYATGLLGRFFLELVPSTESAPPPTLPEPEPAAVQDGKDLAGKRGADPAPSVDGGGASGGGGREGKRRKSGGGKGKETEAKAVRSPSPVPPPAVSIRPKSAPF